MLKVKKMSKLRIAAPKNRMQRVIDTLYRLQLVHLVDPKAKDFFQMGSPLKQASDYSAHLVKVSALVSSLGIIGRPNILSNKDTAIRKFNSLYPKYSSIESQLSEIRVKKNSLNSQLNSFLPLSTLNVKPNMLSGYRSLAVFKGVFRPKKNFEQRLNDICPEHEIISGKYKGMNSVALFVPANRRSKVQELLSENNFSEISAEDYRQPDSLKAELSMFEKKETRLQDDLEKIKSENSQFLLDLEYTLDAEVEKLEAPLQFATTMNSFYLEGWIPEKDAVKIEKALAECTDSRVFVERLETNESPPVALQNPKFAEPFEFFMNLYSLPKPREIDPTLLMFFTFPLFFGFMLGDVGYGITTIVVAFLIRNVFGKQWRMLMNAMLLSGLATIVFGFVFGEFFGFEFIAHPLILRTHDLNFMLLLTIMVGLIHVNFGFLLGFYNKLVGHGLKHAILEKGSWIIMEIGVGIIALEYLGMLDVAGLGMYLGGAVALAGVVMIYLGEGVKGMIELPAILSNILSYARLFAIGLASVQLALIINEFATEFFHAGGFMIIAAIAVLIMGHFINIAIGVLGSFLHSLRLHYVEFFGKFFEGGGVEYVPFGERK